MEMSWPGVENEVAAAQAQHDCSVDAGRPHQRTPQNLVQVIEEQMPAVLGRLDDRRVDLRADGHPVRAVDTRLTQRVHRLRHRGGVLRHVLAVRDRPHARCSR